MKDLLHGERFAPLIPDPLIRTGMGSKADVSARPETIARSSGAVGQRASSNTQKVQTFREIDRMERTIQLAYWYGEWQRVLSEASQTSALQKSTGLSAGTISNWKNILTEDEIWQEFTDQLSRSLPNQNRRVRLMRKDATGRPYETAEGRHLFETVLSPVLEQIKRATNILYQKTYAKQDFQVKENIKTIKIAFDHFLLTHEMVEQILPQAESSQIIFKMLPCQDQHVVEHVAKRRCDIGISLFADTAGLLTLDGGVGCAFKICAFGATGSGLIQKGSTAAFPQNLNKRKFIALGNHFDFPSLAVRRYATHIQDFLMRHQVTVSTVTECASLADVISKGLKGQGVFFVPCLDPEEFARFHHLDFLGVLDDVDGKPVTVCPTFVCTKGTMDWAEPEIRNVLGKLRQSNWGMGDAEGDRSTGTKKTRAKGRV